MATPVLVPQSIASFENPRCIFEVEPSLFEVVLALGLIPTRTPRRNIRDLRTTCKTDKIDYEPGLIRSRPPLLTLFLW
jgi:hypothetical protein